MGVCARARVPPALAYYAIEFHLITDPALPGVSILLQGQSGDNTEQDRKGKAAVSGADTLP